jgi:hypothetical protein
MPFTALECEVADSNNPGPLRYLEFLRRNISLDTTCGTTASTIPRKMKEKQGSVELLLLILQFSMSLLNRQRCLPVALSQRRTVVEGVLQQ